MELDLVPSLVVLVSTMISLITGHLVACRVACATLRDVVGDVCRVAPPRKSRVLALRRARCSLHVAIE